MAYIKRTAEKLLKKLSACFPIVVITGPRQSGKTTLARTVFAKKPFVSLEDMDNRRFAEEDPRGFLARFPQGAVLDEVQHCPSLFSYLQTRVDIDQKMGAFVLTGSQQFSLISRITQSLAGRAGIVQLLPLSYQEVKNHSFCPKDLDTLLYQGLYPAIYDRVIPPDLWYRGYLTTYLERDVRQLSQIHDLNLFQRFIRLSAVRIGQLVNLSALANECGISHSTIRNWFSILEASYVVFFLQPYFKNFNKRLVKMPKIYFYDTGLAAHLQNIQSAEHLNLHPIRGSLFENFIINEYLKHRFNQGLGTNSYFWRDNTGNEIDLILDEGTSLIPIEIKSAETIHSDFFETLKKWPNWVGTFAGNPKLIYAGQETFVQSGVQVTSWKRL